MYIYVNNNDAEKIINLAKDNGININANVDIHKEVIKSEFFNALNMLHDYYIDNFGDKFPNIDINNGDHVEQLLDMAYDDYLEIDFSNYNEEFQDIMISCLNKFML